MNSDSYFEIGTSHLVCQDYALAGSYRDMDYAIVSDGCSSAPFSEIGAQVVCHATQYYLALNYDLFFSCIAKTTLTSLLANSIRNRIDEIRKLYPISRDALQATLLVAVAIKTENNNKPIKRVFVFAWGDGYILTSINNNINTWKIEYPSTNAPVYLITDLNAYDQKFPGQLKKTITHSLQGSSEFTETEISYRDPYVVEFDVGEKDFVAVCTDGLSQYLDQNKKPISPSTIIPMIMDYPNTNGEFVKRTMNFMKREFNRKSWSHGDDIAVATITL